MRKVSKLEDISTEFLKTQKQKRRPKKGKKEKLWGMNNKSKVNSK